MKPIVKLDLHSALAAERVVVELGCGSKKKPRRIGVDCVDLPEVDVVTDLEEGLSFLPDASVDEIHAEHVFEHLENFEGMMREVCRVLKPGGTCRVRVPHFSNPYAYSDPTHKRFFGLYTFEYFVAKDQQQLRRKVPCHYTDIRIRVLRRKLIFRTFAKQAKWFFTLFGRWWNRSTRSQEVYESNPWTLGRLPCQAI